MKRAAHFAIVLVACFATIVAAERLIPLSEGVRDTYLQGFLKGREHLENTKNAERRIILLSGSSLGWSVSAEELTRQLGMPVVNLGVQASMGYRNIWKFYESQFRKDRDIIVFSAAYEMMFAEQGTTETLCDVLFLQRGESRFNFACSTASGQRIAKNLIYLATGKKKQEQDYSADGWNEYGDYVLHLNRPNRHVDHYDDSGLEKLIGGEKPREFIRFFERKQAAGYRLVYLPPTVPSKTCRSREEQVAFVNRSLSDSFGVYFDDDFPFCAEGDLFFNTHYHMNREGRQIKTQASLDVLSRYLEKPRKLISSR